MILPFNEKYTPNKDFIKNGNQKKMKILKHKKFNVRYGGWTHIVGLDNDRKLNARRGKRLREKEQQKKRTSSRHTRNIYKEIEFSL